ncbi:lipoprotein [uncultured Clostridium sp.]|uniref:lipoprotein n=1 Tax=uncultured Clostridium sp. TaxID=59620 RepID=UPI0025E8D186|nr:lipoprotein [uncultured Clostridium sp.]
MNKKIICLLSASVIAGTLISGCGNSSSGQNSADSSSSSAQTASASTEVSNPAQSSAIIDSPTVDVTKVVTVDDLKGKDSKAVSSVLGDPVSEDSNVSTYKKDNYTFEVTYYNSVCGQVKITPETEMKYPADATNSLKIIGITAGDADSLSPSNLTWNNQFNTYSIVVSPSETDGSKLGNINVIFDEQYK